MPWLLFSGGTNITVRPGYEEAAAQV